MHRQDLEAQAANLECPRCRKRREASLAVVLVAEVVDLRLTHHSLVGTGRDIVDLVVRPGHHLVAKRIAGELESKLLVHDTYA